MADQLPVTNKLATTAPSITSEARVERFSTDSYSVRAQIGINAINQKVTVTWYGLTAAETRTVSNFLNSHVINLIAFTPAPFTSERYWTCANHSIETIADNSATASYSITAELNREYDPLSS